MSETPHGLRIVTAAPTGWCDPDTGVCHIETADETPRTRTTQQDTAGGEPDAER